MSAAARGAGSRMEHEDSTADVAPVAGECDLLYRIRCHVDLRVLADAAARGRKFTNVLAVLLVCLRMQISDVLFSFLRGITEEEAFDRHQSILCAVSLMHEVCGNIAVLGKWNYNLEQQNHLLSRFRALSGWGRRLHKTVISTPALSLVWMGASATGKQQQYQRDAERAAERRREALTEVETPFLLPMLFALQSDELRLLPLAATLGRASRGCWNDERNEFHVRTTAVRGLAAGTKWSVRTGHMLSLGLTNVFFTDSHITSFRFSEAWPEVPRRRGGNFSPMACRIPVVHEGSKILNLPGKDCSYLSLALRNWEEIMGTLSSELRIVLEGRFAISRLDLPMVPVFFKNHKSWTGNKEARDALWPVLAQYLIKGQFEYVRDGEPLPLCILPIGAVPKNTPPYWRLVLDCRYTNRYVDPWPVKYLSMATLSLLLSWNCLFCVADIQAAYLMTQLGGCGRAPRKVRRRKTNEAQTGYVEWEGGESGCDPADCGRLCDKSAMGFSADGHVMRAACTPFGMSVSHGTLAIITDALQSYVIRRWRLNMGVFVDDVILIIAMIMHRLCAGILGGCPLCLAAVPAAMRSQDAFDVLLDRLHLDQSDKTFRMAQQGVYLGVNINSNRGLYTLTEKKVAKLVRDLEEVCGITLMSPRQCSKVRGKLSNYSFCMQRIRPFVVPFNHFIGGPRNNHEWDRLKAITEEMLDAAGFLLKHMGTLVRLGAPIWPLQASTVYDRFMRKVLPEPLQSQISVLTHDAADSGIGMVHRESPDTILHSEGKRYSQITTAATFADQLDAQVRREALGAWINFDIYRRRRNISGRYIIIRNDCQSGLFGLMKGSRSPVIQFAAISIAKVAIEEGGFPMFLHVSGKRLIEEGTDDGSRQHAEALRGPACGLALRAKILRLAQRVKLGITLDMFASSCNAVVPRFMSWTAEQTNEREDAFSARSWDVSLCPQCGQEHREIGFYFPPNNLEDDVVRRARSDGARGWFLVPNSAKAGFWQCLTRDAKARYHDIASGSAFTHAGTRKMGLHSLFFVDFAETADTCAPLCHGAGLHRPRRNDFRRCEEAELAELQRHIHSLDDGTQAAGGADGGQGH
jgi:hypothetical protein